MLTAEVVAFVEEVVELFDEPWFKISPSQFLNSVAQRASPTASEHPLAYWFGQIGPSEMAVTQVSVL
jgi:hypothetical protein